MLVGTNMTTNVSASVRTNLTLDMVVLDMVKANKVKAIKDKANKAKTKVKLVRDNNMAIDKMAEIALHSKVETDQTVEIILTTTVMVTTEVVMIETENLIHRRKNLLKRKSKIKSKQHLLA